MTITTKTSIIPHLSCRNAVEAVDFYVKAFGATVIMKMVGPDGRLMHATLEVDGAPFRVVDEFPDFGGHSPQGLGGSPVTIDLNLPDCEAAFAKAVEAGCTVKMPLADMFWGDRYGQVTDPYGHNWSIATTVRDVSTEELEKIIASMGQAECGPDA